MVSLPDTTVLALTPKEVIFHSCPSETTDYDFYVTMAICVTILIALLITAIAAGYCINKKNKSRLIELQEKNAHELSKLWKEYSWKERKDRYDSAWRTIEHSWKESEKIEPCDWDEKHKGKDPKVDKAWSYINYFWGTELNENGEYHKSNTKNPIS